MTYNNSNPYNSYKTQSEGGYKGLAAYKQTEIIHDFTMEFCRHYIKPRKNRDNGYTDDQNDNDYKSYRTAEQMEQAARSGKQNIPEGYAQKEHKSRLKLVKVARGSLEELLVDYQDFLRQHNLPLWGKDDPRAKKVRSFVHNDYNSYNNYKDYLSSSEMAANAMICLINQTNMMLDNKIKWLDENASKEDVMNPFERWKWRQIEAEDKRLKDDTWVNEEIERLGLVKLPNGQVVNKKDAPDNQ